MKTVVALLAAVALALPASAHEGEDHSAPDASSARAAEAPSGAAAGSTRGAGDSTRAATATELFELVAVLSDGRLVVYLDRFETNEPVSAARVGVESGALKTVAVEIEPGAYRIVAEEFAHPGPHPLTIDVQAGDDVDLLSLTVEGPSAPSAGERASSEKAQAWRQPIVWGASGAALLAGAGVVALRRRGAAMESEPTR